MLREEWIPINITDALVTSTLNLVQKNESLIANNLANFETPGFKASSLSFRGALTSAMAKGPNAVLNVKGTVQPVGGSLRPDGSNVSLTGQMTALAQNQLLYQMAVAAYNHQTTDTKIVTEGKAM